jgi:GNAT superfamily N-acetyltransferase
MPMRSRHERMSFEEYRALPMHPAWRHEYYGGMAHLSPRDTAVAFLRLPVAPRPPVPLPAAHCLRPPDPDADRDALADAFFCAFAETVEYCDWDEENIRVAARDAVRTCFAGRRGAFLPGFSRLVVSDSVGVVAAALLVRPESEPTAHLDLLFVRPEAHRTGLATAAVTDCVNALHAAGELLLTSAYHVGNDASVAWHTRFGFVEEPDLDLACARLRCARHAAELCRGDADERMAREAEVARLEALVDELTEREKSDGWESVRPVHRRYRERRRG